MKKYYKYLLLITTLLISITTINVNAAIGYNYSHSGQPMYSTVGLSVTKDGIYTVISDAWISPAGEKLTDGIFKSPEDLFVYTEIDDDGNEKDIIYMVDSETNNLFIFDENLHYQKRFNKFEIKPDNFTEAEIVPIKTSNAATTTGAVSSKKFIDYLASDKKKNLAQFFLIKNIPYEQRKDDEKFYISGNGLSGVYRAVRPVRDERGFIVKGEFQDVIYLTDKLNNQIIVIDAITYEVVQVVTSPTDASFEGKEFRPKKMVTDGQGKMFVISEGVYEGIMQMTHDGKFSSYVGVNYVTLTFWQVFQRRFMTDAQLKSQLATLNTIFTSIAIDKEEFIYTTSDPINKTDDTKMIKRINPAGIDVLTRNGYNVPKGDLQYIRTGKEAGPSIFSSITVNDYGVYTVADEKNGRLFSYDDEGNLLYISAGKGNESTDLSLPVAIRYQGENILVLDKNKKSVLRFEPTDVAKSINKATKYHYEGNLVASSEEWANVVQKNPNYEYAYVGIGKSLLNEERYKEAMNYFQLGYNVTYYSRAYKLSRDQAIQKYFTPVFTFALVLIIGLYGIKAYKVIKLKKLKPDKEGDDFE